MSARPTVNLEFNLDYVTELRQGQKVVWDRSWNNADIYVVRHTPEGESFVIPFHVHAQRLILVADDEA